jgi:hypothetical protein
MLAALLGSLMLGIGLAACGGSSKKAGTTNTAARQARARPSSTTADGPTSTTAEGGATSTAGGAAIGTSTASSPTTTHSGGSGAGSGGSSGGAGLGAGATTTTSTTTSGCNGPDCQKGSPTVPGSVPPVNGKCSSGYVYVAAQDGGPALCIPRATETSTTSSATP